MECRGFGVTHDVYVGTSFDDVNEGTIGSPTYRGNQTDVTYALGDLALETTYYWRIDEVNDAAASSPWKGRSGLHHRGGGVSAGREPDWGHGLRCRRQRRECHD